MIEIQPPNPVPASGRLLFLAGSIEMGAAELWQKRLCERLAGTDWVVLNPRRDQWDSSWEQAIENPNFRQQVEWELEGLERAEKIVFFFSPETRSPVTLLELGIVAARGKNALVVCPPGFWRKGNVDVVCQRYGLRQAANLDEAYAWVCDD